MIIWYIYIMLGVSYLISNILSYLPPVMMLSYSSCRICRKKRRCFSSHELSSWPPPFRWECQPGPSASTASVWATLGRTSIEDGIYIYTYNVCTCIYIYIHTYVCIYIYICIHVHTLYVYIIIYIPTKRNGDLGMVYSLGLPQFGWNMNSFLRLPEDQ